MKAIIIAIKCGIYVPYYFLILFFSWAIGIQNYKLIHRMAVKTIKHCGKKVTVYGLENISHIDDFPFVIYSNHRSMIDPVIIASFIKKDMSFVMKKGLKKNILLSAISKITSSKFFGRTPKEDIETIKEMVDETRKGKSWLIFPEGKRNLEDISFHASTFRIPSSGKSVILPVAVYHTESVIESDDVCQDIKISFLKPIFYDGYMSMKTTHIAKMIENIVAEEVKRLKNV